jgi:hypothetical protein
VVREKADYFLNFLNFLYNDHVSRQARDRLRHKETLSKHGRRVLLSQVGRCGLPLAHHRRALARLDLWLWSIRCEDGQTAPSLFRFWLCLFCSPEPVSLKSLDKSWCKHGSAQQTASAFV